MRFPLLPLLLFCVCTTYASAQPPEPGLTLSAGSELQLQPGSLLTIATGTLRVDAGARLQNQGLVRVAGTVDMEGTYATLLFGPLAGTEYGQVQSGGLTELNGTLSAKLAGDFSPGPDVRFDLFVANPVSGVFETEDLPSSDWSIEYGTNFVSLTNSTVFPVTWLHFTGHAEARGARLDWATAAEYGTDYYGVERLNEREAWQEIARLPAAGESDVRTDYTYLDPTPEGTRLYRLRQTDRDGTFTYSGVVAVSFGAGSALSLYPNPTNGILYLSGSAPGQAYRITDVHGRTVTAGRIADDPSGGIRLPPDLPAGLYVLHPAGGGGLRFTLHR